MPLTDTIVEKPKVGPVKAPGSLVVSLTKVRDKAGSEDCRRSEATAHLTLSRSSSDTEKTIKRSKCQSHPPTATDIERVFSVSI